MYKLFFKRVIDIILSLIALILLSPVLVVVAILVRIKLGGPVLFTQKRPGKNEKIFKMYKFRTMTDAQDTNGILLPDSHRLTKFGRILRSTSLDELPELWNILKGDMSIVGPRPLLTQYLPYYTDGERVRHKVRPGLTGLAQVNGRNNLNWDDRLKLDRKYVETITFRNDMKILIKTVEKVFKREDIMVVGEFNLEDLNVERGKNDL